MDRKTPDIEEIKEIHIIPYSHHDFSWTNSRSWHVWRYLQCYNELLDMMHENKDITWMIDNIVHSWLPFIKYCPERVDEFISRVKEGRIYVANGGMSLARSTYVGEETFIRNMVEGKRYFQKIFDIDQIDFFFAADVACGHSQLPQILKLGGHKYYRFQRPEEALDYIGVPRQFIWKGLDDSQIIVSRGFYGGFMDGRYTNRDFKNEWDEARNEFCELELKDKVNSLLVSDIIWLNYGSDDFRPLRNLNDEPIRIMEFVEEWNKRENSKMLFSNPGDYFKCLSAKELPLHSGVLDHCELSYNAPVRGNASMWRMRSELDRLIIRAESISAFAALNGMEYPKKVIEELWNRLFDITGHAIEWAHTEDFTSLYSSASAAKALAGMLIKESSEYIAGKLQVEEGTQFVVFNILNWKRKEMVKMHVASAFGVSGFDLVDSRGNRIDYQIDNIYGGDKRYTGCEYNSVDIIAWVEVPAMGYTALKAVRNNKMIAEKIDTEFVDYMENKYGSAPELIVVDNGAIEVVLKKGIITGIRETVTGGLSGSETHEKVINGLKLVVTEPSDNWISSWNTVCEYKAVPEKWGMVENGPLQWICRVEGKLGGSSFIQDIIIRKDEKAVGFDLQLDCDGEEGYFAVDFSSDADTCLYADIPFGVEERYLNYKNYISDSEGINNYNTVERGWPGQFYAKNWALFEADKRPAAIVSDNCSIYYNHDTAKNVMTLVLNRCMPLGGKSERWLRHTHPSIEGKGIHDFRYFYYLPEEHGRFSDIVRFCKSRIQPLELIPKYNYVSADKLPLERSYIKTDSENVIVSAFYMEGNSYILRLFETEGVMTNLGISIGFAFKELYLVDFAGGIINGGCKIDYERKSINIDVNPWQIVNLQFDI